MPETNDNIFEPPVAGTFVMRDGKLIPKPEAEIITKVREPLEAGTFVLREGKLVPKYEENVRVDAPNLQKPLEPFVSPIDGKVIADRKQLAAHNKRHGVTHSSDYSDGYIARRAEARNAAGEKMLRETRRRDVEQTVDYLIRNR